MSYHLNVRGLAGLHIGKQVTVKTKHTEASGILQGFKHESEAISDSGFSGESWALGKTHTTITLLPYQNIVAEMMDEVIMDSDKPEPEAPRGWEYQDTERHCGCAEAQEMMGPSMYRAGNIQPAPVHMCDNRNAAHQADMNGETSGQGD